MKKFQLMNILQDYSDDTDIYLEPFQNVYNSDALANSVRTATAIEYKMDNNTGNVAQTSVNISNGITISIKEI